MNGQILSAGTLIHPLPGAHHEDVRGLELLLEGLLLSCLLLCYVYNFIH